MWFRNDRNCQVPEAAYRATTNQIRLDCMLTTARKRRFLHTKAFLLELHVSFALIRIE